MVGDKSFEAYMEKGVPMATVQVNHFERKFPKIPLSFYFLEQFKFFFYNRKVVEQKHQLSPEPCSALICKLMAELEMEVEWSKRKEILFLFKK